MTEATYQTGTFKGNATGKYPISSPHQFNCNGVPVLQSGTRVGTVQISNAGGWIQVHAPGIADPNQYLLSKFTPDMSQFTVPSGTTPGTVAWSWEITDFSGAVFHGTIVSTWTDVKDWLGWHYPDMVSGTLVVESGPLS